MNYLNESTRRHDVFVCRTARTAASPSRLRKLAKGLTMSLGLLAAAVAASSASGCANTSLGRPVSIGLSPSDHGQVLAEGTSLADVIAIRNGERPTSGAM